MSFFFSTASQNTAPFTVRIEDDGDSVSAYPNNYTLGFKSYLETNIPGCTALVTNRAVSGQTQYQMLSDLSSQILVNNPDIITLCTGLNDRVHFENGTLFNNVTTYINTVLSHTNPHSGISPKLLLMTDNLAFESPNGEYSDEPRPYEQQVAIKDTILSAYNQYSNHPSVRIVNTWALFNALGKNSAALANVLLDHVHPNAPGYEMISALANPVLRSLVEDLRSILAAA